MNTQAITHQTLSLEECVRISDAFGEPKSMHDRFCLVRALCIAEARLNGKDDETIAMEITDDWCGSDEMVRQIRELFNIR